MFLINFVFQLLPKCQIETKHFTFLKKLPDMGARLIVKRTDIDPGLLDNPIGQDKLVKY